MAKKAVAKHVKKAKSFIKKYPWQIVTAILVLVVLWQLVGDVDLTKGTGSGTVTTLSASDRIALIDDDPTLGDKDAPVLIVEFSDFQCPFCKRFTDQTFDQIKSQYIDTGKVFWVFRDLPLSFHNNAENAAMAAQCAYEQNEFWDYHDKLFENQNSLDVSSLKKYAADLGLNTNDFDSCLDSKKYEDEVNNDVAVASSYGASGTPSFLINGQLLVGAQPFSAFKSAIDAALSGKGEAAPSPTSDGQVVDTSNDPEIELIVIEDKSCASCDTSKILKITTEQLFPTAKVTTFDYSTSNGKKWIEDLGINALPAYIFGEEVTEAANYNSIANSLVKSGNYYYISAGAAGASKLINPPSSDDDPVKGDSNAPVTIIEFSDFECPFCARFFTDTLPQIQAKYIDTGKVKFVYRDFPLSIHDNAQKAAEAAECAYDQGKFWEYHDLLFENQRSLTITSLKSYASQLSLDQSTFDSCLDSGKNAQEVKDDFQAGVNAGVSGTPAFFVNGVSLSGAQPFSAFEQVIEAELAK